MIDKIIIQAPRTGDKDQIMNDLCDIYSAYMTSPTETMIEDWLAELDVITAKRAGSSFHAALSVEVLTSRLIEYPADVVHDVLRNETYTFWPTWDELKIKCQMRMNLRYRICSALQRGFENPNQDTNPQPTEAEKERAQAAVDSFKRDTTRFKDAKARERPHWSKGLSDDDPRMIALRDERAVNSLTKESE